MQYFPDAIEAVPNGGNYSYNDITATHDVRFLIDYC